MSELADKVALVTGGSRGIGAAIAKRLAADGASVAITYAKDASVASAVEAESLVAEIRTKADKQMQSRLTWELRRVLCCSLNKCAPSPATLSLL
jgi:NAD(P)-dependent dehydrogenase (short-subunit alcohol dehydrogenase family)